MTPRIRPLARSLKTGFLSLSASTGSHCPQSGAWSPAECPSRQRMVSEGELMPAHEGETVLWVYAGPAQESVNDDQEAAAVRRDAKNQENP